MTVVTESDPPELAGLGIDAQEAEAISRRSRREAALIQWGMVASIVVAAAIALSVVEIGTPASIVYFFLLVGGLILAFWAVVLFIVYAWRAMLNLAWILFLLFLLVRFVKWAWEG